MSSGTDSQARTNLYVIGLAPSGYGKDHAAACINTLSQKTALERFLGPARFMSSSALRSSLKEQPSMLCIQDEFGGILRQIDGPKVGVHNEAIRYDLLGMFSRAQDFYAGAAYAQSRAEKIFNPNLSIYGISTPDDFWSALSSARSADGFLPRFIVLNVEGAKPQRTQPRLEKRNPPSALIEASRAIYTAVYYRGNLAEHADGSRAFTAQNVDSSSDASAVADALAKKVEDHSKLTDAKVHPILSRILEHATKLALTVSVGVDPSNPKITAEIMQWAANLAWLSATTMIREIEYRVADNERQRAYQRILQIVNNAGAQGIPKGKIIDKLSGTLRKSDREELLEEAEMTGRLVTRMHKPATGRPSWRYFAA